MRDRRIAKPFVKWAGGKRRLWRELKNHLPTMLNSKDSTYWEPFLGGGAVFFALAAEGLIKNAVLSDSNKDLMTCYKVVKSDIELLIKELSKLEMNHAKDPTKHYYTIRSRYFADEVQQAARLIYLNKTCFNGLYRVNKEGKFNVPMGDYQNPTILDEPNLRAVHETLRLADLKNGDYSEIVKPNRGDFIYCDPPYHRTFSQYVKGEFSEREQRRLAQTSLEWNKRGAYILLNNSDTELINNIYNGGGGEKIYWAT